LAETSEIVQHRRLEQFSFADAEKISTGAKEQLDVFMAQELSGKINYSM
jgi:hypothetical protein